MSHAAELELRSSRRGKLISSELPRRKGGISVYAVIHPCATSSIRSLTTIVRARTVRHRTHGSCAIEPRHAATAFGAGPKADERSGVRTLWPSCVSIVYFI